MKMRLPGGGVSHSHSVANLAQTHVFECPSGKKSALNSTCYDRDFTIPSKDRSKLGLSLLTRRRCPSDGLDNHLNQ